jgi:four helix bundle protein
LSVVSFLGGGEGSGVQDFKQLKVWEKSHRLTLDVYRAMVSFPQEERYGLTSQIRRAASSIPANIAEGCGRDSQGDFVRFLRIALGSASELEYHLILACDLDYLPSTDYEPLTRAVVEVKKMITALIRSIQRH